MSLSDRRKRAPATSKSYGQMRRQGVFRAIFKQSRTWGTALAEAIVWIRPCQGEYLRPSGALSSAESLFRRGAGFDLKNLSSTCDCIDPRLGPQTRTTWQRLCFRLPLLQHRCTERENGAQTLPTQLEACFNSHFDNSPPKGSLRPLQTNLRFPFLFDGLPPM